VHRTDGNTAEIEFLYRQHGPALLLFAQAVTGERGRAQDAVHQVFLKLIEKGSLSQVVDKKAYLFACVRNAALNESKLRDRNAPLDPDAAWFSPPERDYAGEQNLRRALGALPNDQRQVMVLHIWGELTFSGCSVFPLLQVLGYCSPIPGCCWLDGCITWRLTFS
jgi:DNA-directed RNA polymerase specialized sigma24 family protein